MQVVHVHHYGKVLKPFTDRRIWRPLRPRVSKTASSCPRRREEEKEDTQATDEEVAAAQKQTSRRGASAGGNLGDVRGGLGLVPGLGGDDIFDADVLDLEAPAVAEEEVDEGYVLEDEDEELEKEKEEDPGLGPLGSGDETFS
jgi:hypothetical protein